MWFKKRWIRAKEVVTSAVESVANIPTKINNILEKRRAKKEANKEAKQEKRMRANQDWADLVSEAASIVKSSFDDGIISPATGLTGAINTMFAANDLYWEYMDEGLQNHSIKVKIFKGDCFKLANPKNRWRNRFLIFKRLRFVWFHMLDAISAC